LQLPKRALFATADRRSDLFGVLMPRRIEFSLVFQGKPIAQTALTA
jgi:hypothetical protein